MHNWLRWLGGKGFWLVAAVMLLLVLSVGYLSAQSTIKRLTEIYDFRSGLRLNQSTTITGTSGTGTGTVVLPANSVGLGAEVSGYATTVRFCGDLVNTATTYLGPGIAALNGTPTDYVIAGTACSALDSATEATADTALSTLPVKVMGMKCKQSTAPGASQSVTYTFRNNAANAVTTDGGLTTIACAISGASATECTAPVGSTTNIAAGNPVAVQAVSTYDASTHDAACDVLVAWP